MLLFCKMSKVTRSKSTKDKTKTQELFNHKKFIGDRKVFFLKDEILKTTDNCVDIITLRNPSTEKPTKYLLVPEKKLIYEILQFAESHRSWFINETVCSDGKIYITSPIDYLFIILYYLKRDCVNNAVPLDHILKDQEYPGISNISALIEPKQIEQIADKKGPAQLNAYMYNEIKTLNWLEKKCHRLMKVIQSKNIHVGLGAVSATFIKSEKIERPEDNDETMKYCHGIISEYINEDLSEKLYKKLGIPEEKEPPAIAAAKRKSSNNIESNNLKKIKSEEVMDEDENTPINKVENVVEIKVTAKSKALAKAASGTKSIASFFK